jgi:hypothetical protein
MEQIGQVEGALLALLKTFDWTHVMLMNSNREADEYFWSNTADYIASVLTNRSCMLETTTFDPTASTGELGFMLILRAAYQSYVTGTANTAALQLLRSSYFHVVALFADCADSQYFLAYLQDANLLNEYAYILITNPDGCLTSAVPGEANYYQILKAVNSSKNALLLSPDSATNSTKLSAFKERLCEEACDCQSALWGLTALQMRNMRLLRIIYRLLQELLPPPVWH